MAHAQRCTVAGAVLQRDDIVHLHEIWNPFAPDNWFALYVSAVCLVCLLTELLMQIASGQMLPFEY
jgi:hypothetical protein